ncbi:diguanylate cyclase [Methylomonas sp. LW13]|uniref:GGDEF domain-containing protein n=1 Tax=unclassified Methylomonas TaxID=2608980 RepID=UPI0006917B6E|nr:MULTISPECIES: GGDEF domain-containing protein [unclassified Methylomonas]PKD38883.1 GGDEF domain-containing protein [Methylomonas sp. Kb3]QBC29133.1 diguanylate cyclase [Methylomonas sp. LW13]
MDNRIKVQQHKYTVVSPIVAQRWLSQTPACETDSECCQLNQSRAELAALERALAISQQQLADARRQIESLNATRKTLEQQLLESNENYRQALHCAHHDELTGLPNRVLLLDRLQQAMAQADRQQRPVALLFIDLDEFKNINDELGHAAGDQLLKEVAERLSACLRCGDTACRYGGDEFLVLLGEVDADRSVAAVIEKIQSQLAETCSIKGKPVAISASIGAAIYHHDGQSSLDLLNRADSAMYRAKKLKLSQTIN